MERTFSIIKPDAVAKHGIGPVLALIEKGGLRVVAGRARPSFGAGREPHWSAHE